MLGTGDVDYMDPNISYYSIGYLALRHVEPAAVHLSRRRGQTTTAGARPGDRDCPTRPTADQRGRQDLHDHHPRPGAKWNTTPARQVTAADVVRGVKRTCNPVQPFGGMPDFADPHRRLPDASATGSRKVAPDADARSPHYIDKTPPSGRRRHRTTRPSCSSSTQPATYFIDMLTLPAFSPAPVEVLKYLPASTELAQHTVSDGPYQVDSLRTRPSRSTFTRNPAWDAATRPDPQGLRRQDRHQRDRAARTPSSSSCRPAPPAPTWSSTTSRRRPSCPALIAAKDPNLNLGPTVSTQPVRRLQHGVAEQQRRAGEARRSARPWSTR